MQTLYSLFIIVCIWCHVIYAFQLPKDLVFLGCLFRSPAFNESLSLFPETAVRTEIPRLEENDIQFCKHNARKHGDIVFGIYKQYCLHGSKLHLILPRLSKLNKKSDCNINHIRVYSLAGYLGDDEITTLSTKRGYIASPTMQHYVQRDPTKRRIIGSIKNLFTNHGFEEVSDNTQYSLAWSCQGDSDDYQPMYRTNYHPYSGAFCGMCTQRSKRSDGPGQNIENVVLPDQVYKIKGWTKLMYAKDEEELASLQLWVKWQSTESSPTQKKLLAKRDSYLKNDGWTYWNVQFHLPDQPQYRSVYVFFKGPEKFVDIYIDDMILIPMPHREDWKDMMDIEINKNRKRDVEIRVTFDKFQYTKQDLQNAKLEFHQVTNKFGFGTSVHSQTLFSNPKYRSFIKHNFEWATMESSLKWDSMEKVRGVIEHDVTDRMVDILIEDMSMLVRGHCIFWALPENEPKWLLKSDRRTVKRSVAKRLFDVVGRYKNRFKHWDVNNEMLHGWFFNQNLDPSIRNWMFKQAHDVDPTAKLFLNEFDVFAAPTLTQSYLEQIRNFQNQNVPIGGIGVQGHFSGIVHPEIIKERLDILATANIPIWITELDIKEEDESKRADILETIMRVAFSHPSVKGLILWSFWDKHSWRGNNTCLFEGDNFLPNQAGRRYLKLRKQWKTLETILQPVEVKQNECVFKFRTFHGEHAVKIIFPDGQIIEKTLDISDRPQPLLIDFKAHGRESGD